MGTIIISENVSIDGVVQDPTGEEGFARGGWFRRSATSTARRGLSSSFKRRWTPRLCCWAGEAMSSRLAVDTRGGEWADRLRALPSVISSMLEDPVGQLDGPGRRRDQ